MFTLAGIGFFLKRAGFFLFDHWKLVLGGIILLVIVVFVYRACNRPPKLDEKSIQKAQKAIAENDRKAMEEVLTESDVAEKQIDNNLANAENEKLKALQESRKRIAEMDNQQLAAELERRARE
jgi:uncharacterized membrane protein YvbJ